MVGFARKSLGLKTGLVMLYRVTKTIISACRGVYKDIIAIPVSLRDQNSTYFDSYVLSSNRNNYISFSWCIQRQNIFFWFLAYF